MQLSRIKRMSEKRKKAWLEAIDQLEKDYKDDLQDASDCPLCRVSKECDGCLWPIIEGYDCGRYRWGDGHIGFPETGGDNYEEWKTLRLEMLERWRLIIKYPLTVEQMKKLVVNVKESIDIFRATTKRIAYLLGPLANAIKDTNKAIEKREKLLKIKKEAINEQRREKKQG